MMTEIKDKWGAAKTEVFFALYWTNLLKSEIDTVHDFFNDDSGFDGHLSTFLLVDVNEEMVYWYYGSD